VRDADRFGAALLGPLLQRHPLLLAPRPPASRPVEQHQVHVRQLQLWPAGNKARFSLQNHSQRDWPDACPRLGARPKAADLLQRGVERRAGRAGVEAAGHLAGDEVGGARQRQPLRCGRLSTPLPPNTGRPLQQACCLSYLERGPYAVLVAVAVGGVDVPVTCIRGGGGGRFGSMLSPTPTGVNFF
jgi:hypothetical protein